MQVIFQTIHADAARLQVQAERRVRQSFRQLAWLMTPLPRVRVHLSDMSSLHCGIDKSCQIEIYTKNNSPVIVTSLVKTWLLALQSALARAVQSLLHRLRLRPAACP